MFPFLKPAFNILKKVFLVVIVYFVVISLFSHFIAKDKVTLISKTNPILENRKEIYKVIKDKELNKTQQGKITIAIYRGMMCSMMGEACTNNPADADKNYGKSFLGFVSNLIVLPFSNPPASGVAWAYSGLADAGFVQKSLAAEGIGMGSIQPFAKIWKIFRDVTYLLLVIILIAIGFMVMFRTKINPQTVISVENSLPRIIITLILITFSFAIAGFLIDLMYILIAIIISILSPLYKGGVTSTTELQKTYLQAGLGTLYEGIGNNSIWGSVIWSLPNSILNLIPTFGHAVKITGGLALAFFFPKVVNFLTDLISLSWISEPTFGSLEAGASVGLLGTIHLDTIIAGINGIGKFLILPLVLGAIMNYVVPFILGLAIWLTLVFIFFRIVFMLFSSYIKILLSIILSPFYLLFEAIPGQSAFTNWLKGLAGELITFPLIVGIFVLGSIVADSASSGNLVRFPFMVGIDSKSFGAVIGMAIIFMTPDLVKAVRAVFIPKPGILDQAGPGVFFGGVTTGVSTGIGELSKIGGIAMYMPGIGKYLKNIPGLNKLFEHPKQQS